MVMGMERLIFLKKLLTMAADDLRGSYLLEFLVCISLLFAWPFIYSYIELTDEKMKNYHNPPFLYWLWFSAKDKLLFLDFYGGFLLEFRGLRVLNDALSVVFVILLE